LLPRIRPRAGEAYTTPTSEGVPSIDTGVDSMLQLYQQAARSIEQWVVAVPAIHEMAREVAISEPFTPYRLVAFQKCVDACEDAHEDAREASAPSTPGDEADA